MRQFYINVRVIYDKSIPKKERIKLATTDEILKDTLHEANKNQVHKDDKYQPKQLSSLKELISTLKERLEHCMKLCHEALPKGITLDYVSHDKELFRLMNGITVEVEEVVKQSKHPEYKVKHNVISDFAKKVFHDTEDMRTVKNSNDYAVIIEEGINVAEGLQNRQDFCIKINVLYDLNTWVKINR